MKKIIELNDGVRTLVDRNSGDEYYVDELEDFDEEDLSNFPDPTFNFEDFKGKDFRNRRVIKRWFDDWLDQVLIDRGETKVYGMLDAGKQIKVAPQRITAKLRQKGYIDGNKDITLKGLQTGWLMQIEKNGFQHGQTVFTEEGLSILKKWLFV